MFEKLNFFRKQILKPEQPLTVHSKYYIASLTTPSETYFTFSQRVYVIGKQIFIKISKRKSNSNKSYENSDSEP